MTIMLFLTVDTDGFGVKLELCVSYEAYFGAGTKLTVLGKFQRFNE